MTSAQRIRFYFPAWRKCAAANDWVMVRGRLVADLAAQATDTFGPDHPLTILKPRLIGIARRLALQEHRSVTADDLRRACNFIVSGKSIHSDDLNNSQVSRVVDLFHLLQDENDFDAVAKWENPQLSERESMKRYLAKLAPDATVRAIAANAFGTRLWEDLEDGEIRWLLKTVKGQRNVGQRNKSQPTFDSAANHSTAAEDRPF